MELRIDSFHSVNVKDSCAVLETLDPCYYLEACKDIGRNFLPSLEEFFSEAIQEINPKNQVKNILIYFIQYVDFKNNYFYQFQF